MQKGVNQESNPKVTAFFDDATNTFSYVIEDLETRSCAIIDSVLDLDYASGTISYGGVDRILRFVRDMSLDVKWILETHIHADHLSAAPYLRQQTGGKIGIGTHVEKVKKSLGPVFFDSSDFDDNNSTFDMLFDDSQELNIGGLNGYVLHTPGHTPACVSYIIGDAVFVGDTLFMPDGGTARADFPGGDARELYHSIKKILTLPPQYRVFVCHDYMPGGRETRYESTVGEQSLKNIHLSSDISEEEYVAMRRARDATLSMPSLILPSIQVNIRAGHLPVEQTGRRYFKIPINSFGTHDPKSSSEIK